MKPYFVLALISLFVSIWIVEAPAPVAANEISVAESITATGINPNTAEPTGVTDTFSPETPGIYFAALLSAPAGTELVAHWMATQDDGSLIEFSNVRHTLDANFVSPDWVWFNIPAPEGGWPLGNYNVILTSDSWALAIAPFRVVESAPDGPATSVEVNLEDPAGSGSFGFDPSEFDFVAGQTVSFILSAEGMPHTFTINAMNIDRDVSVGATETVEVTFNEPGTYDLICRFHEQLGMVGTINVSQ